MWLCWSPFSFCFVECRLSSDMFDDCSVTDLYPYWNPEKEIVIGFVRTLSLYACFFSTLKQCKMNLALNLKMKLELNFDPTWWHPFLATFWWLRFLLAICLRSMVAVNFLVHLKISQRVGNKILYHNFLKKRHCSYDVKRLFFFINQTLPWPH